MSSIRSASSRTRISTWPRFATFWPTRSSSRPGVATRISTPLRSALIWGSIGIAAVDDRRAQRHGAAVGGDAVVHLHRELAGRDEDQRRGPDGGPARSSCWRARAAGRGSGRTKAAVLPVPVWAAARTSRPSRTSGMAAVLDGRGSGVAFLGDGAEEIGREAERVEGQAGSCLEIPSRPGAGSSRRQGPDRRRGTERRSRAARSIPEIGGAPVRPPVGRRPAQRKVGVAGAPDRAILAADPQKADPTDRHNRRRRPPRQDPCQSRRVIALDGSRTGSPGPSPGTIAHRSSRATRHARPRPTAAGGTTDRHRAPPRGVPAERRQESCRSRQAAPSGRPPPAGCACSSFQSWPWPWPSGSAAFQPQAAAAASRVKVVIVVGPVEARPPSTSATPGATRRTARSLRRLGRPRSTAPTPPGRE